MNQLGVVNISIIHMGVRNLNSEWNNPVIQAKSQIFTVHFLLGPSHQGENGLGQDPNH